MSKRINITEQLHSAINKKHKDQYLKIFESIDKTKNSIFIVDEKLSPKLDLLSTVSELKERGISQIFYLKKFNFELYNEENTLIFAIRPNTTVLEYIIKNLIRVSKETKEKTFTVELLCVGTSEFEIGRRWLENEGVSSLINLHCLSVYGLFIDSDILSLQNQTAYKQLYIVKKLNVE